MRENKGGYGKLEKIVIEGGTPFKGEVCVSVSKNSILPLMAACILNDGENSFENVPDLMDVRVMGEILTDLGAMVELDGGRLSIDSSGIGSWVTKYEMVKRMRASVLTLGPLTARFGRARVSLPGGCSIGERPIDQHMKGLEALGAEIKIESGYVETSSAKMKGVVVPLDMPTVTGTENLMLAAVLADGETVIYNAACEPEVSELAGALNLMGADISGIGTDIIKIRGVSSLKPLKNYEAIPDRIEAGTLMIAAVASGGSALIKGARFEHLGTLAGKLMKAGAEVEETAGGIHVRANGRVSCTDITTLPYPGFPTDMQAQFMALMCTGEGISIMTENIFPQRFMHIAEMKRMGGDIKLIGNAAVVKGIAKLKGAQTMASDLRAGAALAVAGTAAKGKTEISRVYHLDRGYEKLDKKFEQLGASVWREKE